MLRIVIPYDCPVDAARRNDIDFRRDIGLLGEGIAIVLRHQFCWPYIGEEP